MLASLIAAGGNLLGGIMGSNSAEKNAKRNIQLQKDFAQQGIQWKVADAKAAGIHPLAALGAQTTSFSPVSVGSDQLATGIAGAGQDISRAINATRSDSQRLDAYNKTVQDLSLRRMGLENELLASQIAKINQAGTPPPLPSAGDRYLIEGQQGSGLVKTTPLPVNAANPGQPSIEAGAVSDMGAARTTTGWAPVMSHDFKQRAEEDLGAMISWNVRNRLLPTLGFNYNPPKTIKLSDGEIWYFNPIKQEYQPYRP